MITLKFNNPDLNTSSLAKDLKIGYQRIQEGLTKTGIVDQTELSDLLELIATTEKIFPNALKDIQQLKEMRTDLCNRVSQIAGKGIPQEVENGQISPEIMGEIPPVGIRNSGNNCCFNALGQFLAGAPGLASIIIKRRPRLGKLIQEFYDAQIHGNVVSETFGRRFRNWITDHLSEINQKKWIAENNHRDTQVDVMEILHTVFEQAGIEYTFTQEIEDSHGTYPLLDQKTGNLRTEKHDAIEIYLPGEEKTFLDLLDTFFETKMSDSGKIKRSKFEKAPEDLIVSTFRFGYSRGKSYKTQLAVKDVPSEFFLSDKYTQENQEIPYQLTGCIIHNGSEKGGHYTYLRRVGDTWYLIDDAKVKEIANPTPYLEQGYVFHYQKAAEEDLHFVEGHSKENFSLQTAARYLYHLVVSLWGSN